MKTTRKFERKTLHWSLAVLTLFVFALGQDRIAGADEARFGFKQTETMSGFDFTQIQHRGPPEGRGSRHDNCPEMSDEKGCMGGQGMRHGGGKHHGGGMGMHHGGGQGGSAQCPQPRATVKAPGEFYNLVNPLKNTPENIEAGRSLFSTDVQPTCVMCHGDKGDGTGGFGSDMSPKPRNFTCMETMKDIPDGQLFWVIQKGSPDTGMPPFQGLQDEQIWQLVLYIREFGK